MDYFYIDEFGKKNGPLPEIAVRVLYNGGVINGSTLVAMGDSGEWQSCLAVFGVAVAPLLPPRSHSLPPPFVKRVPTPVPATNGKSLRSSPMRLVGCFVAVAAAALGVTSRYFHLPFLPSATIPAGSVPSALAKKAASLQTPPLADAGKAALVVPAATPALAKAGAVKGEPQADPLVEWYDFGFHQGEEARRIFSTLGKKLEPSKEQVMQLLFNLNLNSASVDPDKLQACFDGYKEGCQGGKASRTISASQKRSTLPSKLQGYHKFASDRNRFAGANSDVLEHALASTVMIVTFTSTSAKQGSGFFVAPGLLVTNRHVTKGGERFDIRMPDKSIVQGKLVAEAEDMDVALLSIPVTTHPVLSLRGAQTLRVGDSVIAVGFPASDVIAAYSGSANVGATMQQMEATSTFGYISALNRLINNMECFQLDLTINHGNSGGPTLDSDGRVVGISTFTLGQEQIERTNFAIKMSSAIVFISKHCTSLLELED